MGLSAIPGQTWARWSAVAAVLALAGFTGYALMDTGPVYSQSATVIFESPGVLTSPQRYLQYSTPLITTASVMARELMSPQSQHRVRSAGGTADYTLSLVNLYNQDYPDFSYPMATLTTTSPSPSAARRTFAIAERLLRHLLAARQAQVPVRARYRIDAHVIADSGPVAQAGSAKRELAGLAALAVIGAVGVRNFLMRHGAGRAVRAAAAR